MDLFEANEINRAKSNKKIQDGVNIINEAVSRANNYPERTLYIKIVNKTNEKYIPKSYIKYFDVINSGNNYMDINFTVDANNSKYIRIRKGNLYNQINIHESEIEEKVFTLVNGDKYIDKINSNNFTNEDIATVVNVEAFEEFLKKESMLALKGVTMYIKTAEECDYLIKVIEKQKEYLLNREKEYDI